MRRTVKNNREQLLKYVVTVKFSAWKFPINWWLLSYKNQQKGEFSFHTTNILVICLGT